MFVLAACDAGWVKFNGACYKFESDAKQYFGGAVKACNEMDAHLLHIESEAERPSSRKLLAPSGFWRKPK